MSFARLAALGAQAMLSTPADADSPPAMVVAVPVAACMSNVHECVTSVK